MKCPRCDIENDDNWPITVDGKIENGGCQECWEAESDAAWWNMVVVIDKLTAESTI